MTSTVSQIRIVVQSEVEIGVGREEGLASSLVVSVLSILNVVCVQNDT